MKKVLAITDEIVLYDDFNDLANKSEKRKEQENDYGITNYNDYLYISSVCAFVSFSMYLNDMNNLKASFAQVYKCLLTIKDGLSAFDMLFCDKMYAIGDHIEKNFYIEFAQLLDTQCEATIDAMDLGHNYTIQSICYEYAEDNENLEKVNAQIDELIKSITPNGQ